VSNKIYILTNDVFNPRLRELINYIKNAKTNSEFIIVSGFTIEKNSFNLQHITLKKNNLNSKYLFLSKFVFLFSKANSKTDKLFYRRNIYLRSKIIKLFINILWRLKNIDNVNKNLPWYDNLLFYFVQSSHMGVSLNETDTVIFDSLLIRNITFLPLIKYARGICRIESFVFSFDNPFYSQFYRKSDKYYVWSEEMVIDINQNQNLFNSGLFEIIGPFPFFSFVNFLKKVSSKYQINKNFIGYACSFPDKHMLSFELELIKKLAKICDKYRFKLLVRPYPSVNLSYYSSLTGNKSIVIYNYSNLLLDRFNDGSEFINFGGDEEKINFLNNCQIFVSFSTSFTIEAALYGLPIIQLYFNSCIQSEKFCKNLFERFEISDHLLKYFKNGLNVVYSFIEFENHLKNFDNKSMTILDHNIFLKQFGFSPNNLK
jgi:hypothetical protein